MPLANQPSLRSARLALLVCLVPLGSVCAGQATLRGFVTDRSSGQALVGASVVLSQGDEMVSGTATNEDGLYVLSGLPPGRYPLAVSFIGYEAYRDTLTLSAGELRSLNVALASAEAELDEVVVEERGGAADVVAGLQTIRPAEIDRVPTPGPSGDLATYLTTLPGVVSIGDQGGQLFIRGGEPSQNLVLLDGMVVYQPFHLLGFFSAFPSDILSSVDLYAGGYGAAFGGRLASVIDVSARAGNKRRWAGMAAAAPFLSAARIEGPVVRDRVSVLASGRLSVVEQFGNRLPDRDLPFRFGDAFAKAHAALTRNSQVSVAGLYTYDRGFVGEAAGGRTDEVRWENTALGGRYLLLPVSLPMSAEVLVSYSRLETELGPTGDPARTSSIAHVNTGVDATYFTRSVDVSWGLFARTLEFASELGGLYQNVEAEREFNTEVGLYLEPEIRLGRGLEVVPGLHVNAFPSKGKTFVEPRMRAVWTRGSHRVSGAAGLYHQEIVGLNDRRDATNVFTAWTATPFGEVPTAVHALLGYHVRFTSRLEGSVEGFYKRLSNLFVGEWTAFPRLTTRLQQAEGETRGLDVRLEARGRRLYGMVGYGLSSTRYEARQEGFELWYGQQTLRYRPPHDRRHQVNVLASAEWGGFDLSVRWQFGSGLPFSRALGFDRFILMSRGKDVFAEPGRPPRHLRAALQRRPPHLPPAGRLRRASFPAWLG